MAKKILFAILISILLTSCVSIREDASVPASQQDFVTAMLVPTVARWIPVTSTVLPETRTPSPAMTALANCTNTAILLQDVTIFGVGYAYFSQSDYGGYITVDFGG